MSTEASAPVAAPVPVEPTESITAPPAHDSQFGAAILGKKDEAAPEPAVEQQPAESDAAAASAPAPAPAPAAAAGGDVETSEHEAAAVAAAAAAAAAADASSAAQTITELATAATNAANSAPVEASSSSAEQPVADATATQEPIQGASTHAASAADASNSATAPTDKPESAEATGEPSDEQQDGAAAATAAGAEQQSTSGLPRNVESELRDIYAVSSAIANFSVAHVNQVNVPTPQKVRTIIQKALKLTSSLSMLLAQPEVALRQLDADDHAKRPAESKLDSARKRQRSSDWDGNKVAPGTPGLPMTPYTPSSGLRVFPDGSLPTSFPSPGFDGEGKGPQYKKRSRAPAPGSCQACGTSETPEWRRGPDGARTLCNACGLHYAKLVRKRMQQEGGEEPSPSHAPPQVSLVSLEELRASTKSAEAAAAAGGGGGMSASASSSSLNGTPLKVNKHEAWSTPSKPPRVPSSLGSSVLGSHQLEGGDKPSDEVAPPPPAPAPETAPQTAGIVEPAPTPVAPATSSEAAQQVPEPVIAPELAGEAVPSTTANSDERPMETDQ